MSPSSASARTRARWSRSDSACTSRRGRCSPWTRNRCGCGILAAILASGACGWFIGRIAFKVRGAYFVIVSISFAEVVRLVAVNWVELTQGPMALNNIPPLTLWLPGLGEHAFWKKPENYWLVLTHRGRQLRDHSPPGPLARGPRHDRAARERAARDLGRHRRHALSRAGDRGLRGDGRRGGCALRPLHPHRRSRRVPVHLHRDHGDHGRHRRQGHARRPRGRRAHLRAAARDAARARDPARGRSGSSTAC